MFDIPYRRLPGFRVGVTERLPGFRVGKTGGPYAGFPSDADAATLAYDPYARAARPALGSALAALPPPNVRLDPEPPPDPDWSTKINPLAPPPALLKPDKPPLPPLVIPPYLRNPDGWSPIDIDELIRLFDPHPPARQPAAPEPDDRQIPPPWPQDPNNEYTCK
jgi:hypothetical protein